jgi:hypothetical protein
MISVTIPDVYHESHEDYLAFKQSLEQWFAQYDGPDVQWRHGKRGKLGWDHCFLFSDDALDLALLFKLTWAGQ